MNTPLRLGTRDSQLAVWQATLVKDQLLRQGVRSELVFIKSEGDINLATPLYEIGVQGIFTKTLDVALLTGRIDLAVHSMKDVPTQLAQGLASGAILPRANDKDILVYNGDPSFLDHSSSTATIATSSIRRRAQWLYKYPHHTVENLRGNVNTRLKKVADNQHWHGAIFAAAGLERINVRPAHAIDLNWMLPAPAQGAIMVVCRENDKETLQKCAPLHHSITALCTKAERDFLRALQGGCSTPIGALAEVTGDTLLFKGNVFSPDGKQKVEIEKSFSLSSHTSGIGTLAAREIMEKDTQSIIQNIRHAAASH